MSEHSSHTATRSKVLIALSIVVITVVAIGIYHERHTTTFIDATSHQPERYTELYFSDPTALPSNVVHGTRLPVGFMVHNVEARTTAYTAQVSLVTTAGKTLNENKQSFALPANASESFTSDVTVPDDLGRAEVQVLLPSLKQSIHFWVQIR